MSALVRQRTGQPLWSEEIADPRASNGEDALGVHDVGRDVSSVPYAERVQCCEGVERCGAVGARIPWGALNQRERDRAPSRELGGTERERRMLQRRELLDARVYALPGGVVQRHVRREPEHIAAGPGAAAPHAPGILRDHSLPGATVQCAAPCGCASGAGDGRCATWPQKRMMVWTFSTNASQFSGLITTEFAPSA